MFARLVRNEQGATMVELSIVFGLLMLLSFGVVEFGFLWWQWNSAEKATQMGVRKAVITSPVATGLSTADCGNANVTPGTLCSVAGATSFGTITCTGSGTSWASPSGSCTGCAAGVSCTFSTDAFTRIGTIMQEMFPFIQPQNVQVTYAFVGLGFAGRPGPVPTVTVQLTGMNYNFFALQGFLGFAPIPMPGFEATLTGEDLDSFAPS
jgi:Flp pilus assembly pilin Flp